jgi:uncharacterized surface protein with fasciclin (FAS1) repeats
MAAAPVATAASANPVLSTLVTAVKKAGLVDTLNSAANITVFAPDNAAFAKLPKATLDKVLADKALLTKILTYHVADGRQTPGELASGTGIKTLEGGMVTPAVMGSTHSANGRSLQQRADSQRTVYIIDTVLTPGGRLSQPTGGPAHHLPSPDIGLVQRRVVVQPEITGEEHDRGVHLR